MKGPPPAGARLGLYRHGDTVSERTALALCALPAYAAHWLILPALHGDALTLAWGAACTPAELMRAHDWNAAQLARLEADRLPVGRA